MQASDSQAEEILSWLADVRAASTCNLPSFFTDFPVELQDMILTHVLSDFCRPETSDPGNNGRYIGESTRNRLALMPWRIDTRILEHPDKEVNRRAKKVMLKNQFVYIKSESVNLLPIFHAAQVPIVTLSFGRFDRSRLEELSKYFILTHEIERLGGLTASMTTTSKPWGRTRRSIKRFGLTGHFVPRVQEYVILGKDLALFCRALDGADSGYYHFGACTRHTLEVHGPFDDILTEHLPVLSPSSFLKPYREILRGFTSFTIQGRIWSSLALDIRTKVRTQTATPQFNDIMETIGRLVSQGDEQLSLNQPISAAHAFARGAQELIVLYSKGILPRRADSSPMPELAELYLVLGQQQAQAWLAVMQQRKEAARGGSNQDGRGDAQLEGRGDRLYEGRSFGEAQRNLSQLVYDAGTLAGPRPPPPLDHQPDLHDIALELYRLAKADRLSDAGSEYTWMNIQTARRLAPEDEEIRREAELIDQRVEPWTLQWIPE